MHIPDGYLGPPTYLASYAACAPLWGIAARKVKAALVARRVPLLAISAAFTFVVNQPVKIKIDARSQTRVRHPDLPYPWL